MKRKLIKTFLILSLVLAVGAVIAIGWGYRQLSASLPQLDGTLVVDTLSGPAQIQRDQLGVPTISGANRLDVSYALGFAHGQDRFFQMDLLRRNAAGELSELVGDAVLDEDKSHRIHRFRNVAQQRLQIENPEVLNLLETYTAGVNAGLKSLKQKPFEYLLLGSEPAPWKMEDCLLCVFSMYLALQDDQFDREADRGLLHDTVPQEMYDFLMARGNQWDAPIQGEAFEVPNIPGPELFDLRAQNKVAIDLLKPFSELDWDRPYILGSNNWAVSGKLTKDGRALISDDMHLMIQVPHIWYRASLKWPAGEATDVHHQVTGVSLPGAPVIVVGSNHNIAWGFTNTEGDWLDVVIVEVDPNDPNQYLTAEGPKAFEKHVEKIKVKGGTEVDFEVLSTMWGPIMRRDHQNRPLAARWVAYQTEGVNLELMKLETVASVDQALDVANRCGVPHQNFVVGDAQGNIAWTVLGRIPRRFGFDGRLPQSWTDGTKGWDGYLEPTEYPRVVNPDAQRIWTANARVVSGQFYQLMGDSGYDCGARQQQIRDDLMKLDSASEVDMLKIQLDDRAVFLQPWQELMVGLLDDAALADHPDRQQLREYVQNWGGRAAKESVGFRSVWQFRNKVSAHLADLLGQACKQKYKKFDLQNNRRIEGPFWRIVQEQPGHLLDPRFKTWRECLLASVDAVIRDAKKQVGNLSDYTWGNLNTTNIQHPLSMAVPALSGYLDMPRQPVDGAWSDMPRIQAPKAGASQRMAVSPGREQDGYMQIPCGQSGHPLSPFYNNSHNDWVQGNPTPFLPGPAIHTLTLSPK